MNRTIVIGDLHGCKDEAIELLDRCQATSNDRIIFAGDLVDRGPDNAGCVELAMQHECVLGNHEEKHIKYNDEERLNGYVNVHVESHVRTRKQLLSKHYDYFRSLPKYIKLPEHNAAVVHAGAYPGRSLEKQSSGHLLHVSMLQRGDDGSISERSAWASRVPIGVDGWNFWTNYWTGPERLIFGHSVLDRPLISKYAVGIDGGCCFGRELWAIVLPDWKIVSVKSRLSEFGRTQKPVFKIHGDVGTY